MQTVDARWLRYNNSMRRVLPLLWLSACTGDPVDKSPDVVDTAAEACAPFSLSNTGAWVDADLLGQTPPDVQGGNAGIGLGDLDGDGWLDALVVTAEGSLALANDGTGQLKPTDAFSFGGAPLPAASGISLGDLDGDGDLDAWLGRRTSLLDLVAINDGQGVFELVEVPDSSAESFSGALGDLDGDGDLDLFVARYAEQVDPAKILDGTLTGGGNAVYVNDGAGRLQPLDGALPADVVDDVTFMGSLVDTDADGDLDLYLANDFGPFLGRNRLLLNDGSGSFEDDPACFCDLDMFAMGVGVGDANADGLVDLYLTDLAGPDLLLSDGDGAFYEGALAMSASVPNAEDRLASWGTSFVDFDLDGFEDIAMVFGPLFPHGDPDGLAELGTEFEDWIDGLEQRDALLHNQGGSSFVDVSATVGFEDPSNGRALAVGDLDRDGRPDLVTAGLWFARTWHTEGGCGRSVTVQFKDDALSRAPGGQLRFTHVDGSTATRWITPATTWSSSATEVVFGLGTDQALESIVFEDIRGNQQQIDGPLAGEVVVFGSAR